MKKITASASWRKEQTRLNQFSTIILAVAGPSGSGKSSFAGNVKSLFDQLSDGGLSVAILSEDAYYRRQDHLSISQRHETNYDHPDAIDQELLHDQLLALKKGGGVDVPIYDYQTHNRADQTMAVGPCDVVIVEGILLLSREHLRPLFDLSLFVDVELSVCRDRRIERDVRERGRTVESVRQQFAKTVEPMFHEYVAPSKAYADLLIPNGGDNSKAVEVVCSHLVALVSRERRD